MGCHIGGHTHGDAAGAVHQQAWNLRGQHGRLLRGVIKSILEVNGILFEVVEHLFGNLLQTRLGITHGGGTVTVHRTEVTLGIHQGITQRPPLGHTCQGVIYGGVAMRVIVTHHFTDDLSGFPVGSSRCDAHVLHAIQHTALHRFEAVAHIGKGTRHDDRHRIVDVSRLHLVLKVDLDNFLSSVFRNIFFLIFRGIDIIFVHFGVLVFALINKGAKLEKKLIGFSKSFVFASPQCCHTRNT